MLINSFVYVTILLSDLNKLDRLKRCYLCAVKGYLEENCSPMLLQVPSGYHVHSERGPNGNKAHLATPALEIILEIYCALPPQQQPVSTSSEIQPCSSPLPCAETESLGNEQIENILSKHWQIARKRIDETFCSQKDPTTWREIIRSAGKSAGTSTVLGSRGQGGVQAQVSDAGVRLCWYEYGMTRTAAP